MFSILNSNLYFPIDRLQFRHLACSFRSIFSKSRYGILLGLVCMACSGPTTSFKTFESDRWIAESQACTSYRNSVIEAMKAEFELFIGMNESELIEHLGNPDETQLYTRGQKFFKYHLTCPKTSNISKKLRIRFSALNQVNEVLILD